MTFLIQADEIISAIQEFMLIASSESPGHSDRHALDVVEPLILRLRETPADRGNARQTLIAALICICKFVVAVIWGQPQVSVSVTCKEVFPTLCPEMSNSALTAHIHFATSHTGQERLHSVTYIKKTKLISTAFHSPSKPRHLPTMSVDEYLSLTSSTIYWQPRLLADSWRGELAVVGEACSTWLLSLAL